MKCDKDNLDLKIAETNEAMKRIDISGQERLEKSHNDLGDIIDNIVTGDLAEALKDILKVDNKIEEHLNFHKFPLVRRQDGEGSPVRRIAKSEINQRGGASKPKLFHHHSFQDTL